MSVICACEQSALSTGITSCYNIPAQIKKVVFTTSLAPTRYQRYSNYRNNIFLAITPPASQNAWYYESGGAISTAIQNDFEYFLYYKDSYKLSTTAIDLVESERGDAVREEVGGKTFFVRDSSRSFTLTFVAKPAEMIGFIEQLRCQKELGLFLIDAAGIVWGARRPFSFANNVPPVAPIPVIPASLSAKLEFPSSTTVQKIRVTFETDHAFSDAEFVPLIDANTLVQYNHVSSLDYESPRHVRIAAYIDNVANEVVMRLYTEIHASTNVTTIPLTPSVLGTYLPVVVDSTNAVVGPASAWTHQGNGIYTQPTPTGAFAIVYPSATLASTAPIHADFYSVYARL